MAPPAVITVGVGGGCGVGVGSLCGAPPDADPEISLASGDDAEEAVGDRVGEDRGAPPCPVGVGLMLNPGCAGNVGRFREVQAPAPSSTTTARAAANTVTRRLSLDTMLAGDRTIVDSARPFRGTVPAYVSRGRRGREGRGFATTGSPTDGETTRRPRGANKRSQIPLPTAPQALVAPVRGCPKTPPSPTHSVIGLQTEHWIGERKRHERS